MPIVLPQVQESNLPNVQMGAPTSIDAFGGGKSMETLGEATQGLEKGAFDIANEEKQKADQLAFMSADGKLSAAQTQIQVNSSKMLGKEALGAPDYAKQQWDDSVQKIQSGLNNDAQKMAFARSANSRWDELNKTVQVHVGQQMTAFDDSETSGYLENSKNAAVLNAGDDDKVDLELSRQRAALTDWAQRKGIPTDSDTFKSKLTDQMSGTSREVIAARLDKDSPDGIDQAKDYFESHRDQMNSQDVISVQKAIDSAETTQLGLDAWDKVKGMKLSDGMPDESRMEASIMGRDDMSPERKISVLNFVKARAKEEILQKNMSDADNERQFMNDLVQTRQQGASLQDALKLADRYAIDPYDQTVKAHAVQQVYAPPTDSNQVVKYNLWQGAQDGSISTKDIDAAMTRGDINQKDWSSLKEDYYKVQTEGRSPEMKYTNDRIKELAESTFSDKKTQAEFLNTVNSETINLSPQEKFKKAQDLMQVDPKTQHSFLGITWGGDKQFSTDTSTRDATNLAFGKAQEDLGPDTVKAIGQGVLRGQKSFTPADLDSFSSQMGGYDKIKPGTRNYSAIQWLIQKNMPVVPENVKAAVQAGKGYGGQ